MFGRKSARSLEFQSALRRMNERRKIELSSASSPHVEFEPNERFPPTPDVHAYIQVFAGSRQFNQVTGQTPEFEPKED